MKPTGNARCGGGAGIVTSSGMFSSSALTAGYNVKILGGIQTADLWWAYIDKTGKHVWKPDGFEE
jgi:hypothetical protein